MTKNIQTMYTVHEIINSIKNKKSSLSGALEQISNSSTDPTLGLSLHTVRLNDSWQIRVSMLRQRSYSFLTFGVSMMITDNGITYFYHLRFYFSLLCYRLCPRCCLYLHLFGNLCH